MIVKMKKASFIFLETGKEEALDKIRQAGVVHLEQEYKGSSETLSALTARYSRLERALFALAPKVKAKEEAYNEEEAEAVSTEVLDILNSIKASEDKRLTIASDLAKWENWGDFDPSEVSILRSRGVDMRFYSVSPEVWEDISSKGHAFVVNRVKNEVFGIIAFTPDESAPETETFPLPSYGISELKIQDEEEIKKKKKLEARLLELSTRKGLLKSAMALVAQDMEYESLRSGLGSDEQLLYFTGFLPQRDEEKIKALCAENGWAVVICEPDKEDAVPTLVENNKAVNTIKPLFDILEVLPGYRELDISLDFLIFFTLFFAMIIGDAGYGLLFLGITLFARFKAKKGGPAFNLMYLLSGATIIWGLLTGNLFGSQTLGSWAPLKNLVIPNIAAFPQFFDGNYDSSYTIKYMCFIVGTFQLCIARIKNFLFRMPSVQAFAQLGWLAMLIGVYHIVLFLVLSMGPISNYVLYLIFGGLAAVVIFGEQEKGVSFFKGLGKGFAGLFTTFLDGIGLLAHIISYIRLFAVGLASLAIASSFNAMAAPLMHGPAMIGAVLILVLGHGLNITMGALALIVHGVRLNMLEYSGHLDMEWSGIKYEPFKKVQNQQPVEAE